MLSVIYSEKFLAHNTGRFHPERAQRLTAIVEALHQAPFAAQLDWQQPTPVGEVLSLVRQVHNPEYVAMVAELAGKGGGLLDADTPVAVDSYEVALLAVRAWLDGVDQVVEHDQSAFVLARPPGHHAERKTGMGFCLFSNAAIAAHYALGKPGINKVAILDWDVHHGNGTQEIVQDHPRLAYCSLHQSPCYPGTGYPEEVGKYNNVLNIPMSPGSNMTQYQPAFTQKVIPFLQKFAPDLLIISAGYDAAKDDPLAAINLSPLDYYTFTTSCRQVKNKILFGLEGGYHLGALSASVAETIRACLD
jgi:acetoin utilization deacetylase AcuC-like enzyme